MFIVLILFAVLAIGAIPSYTVGPPDDQQCRHITLTRFFGYQKIIDTYHCPGDDPITLNGETITGEAE